MNRAWLRQLGRSVRSAAGLTLLTAAIAWTLPAVIPQPILDRPEDAVNLSVRFYDQGWPALDGETEAALLELLSEGRCTRRFLWPQAAGGHPIGETIDITLSEPGRGEAHVSTELVLGSEGYVSMSRRTGSGGAVRYRVWDAGALTRQVEELLAGAAEGP